MIVKTIHLENLQEQKPTLQFELLLFLHPQVYKLSKA